MQAAEKRSFAHEISATAYACTLNYMHMYVYTYSLHHVAMETAVQTIITYYNVLQ